MVRIAAGIDEPDDGRNKPPVRRKGWLAAYIHAGRVGVMLEVHCISQAVALSDELKELTKDLAMHIAATAPKFISREDVPREVCLRQEEIFRREAASSEDVAKKMEGFLQEICLLEQAFVKESAITVGQLLATRSDEWGDDITIRRFVRFAVGEAETVAVNKSQPK